MQRVLRCAGVLTLVVGLAACDRNGTDNNSANQQAGNAGYGDTGQGTAGTSGTAGTDGTAGTPGTAGTSGTLTPSADSQAAMPQDLPHFAMMANHAEIELSRLAVEKAQNPQVKQFARQMITDHTRAMRQLERMGSASAAHAGRPSTMGSGAEGTPHGSQQPGRHTPGQQPGHAQPGHSAAEAHGTAQRHNLDTEHQQIYDRLSALSGAEFDREYMRVMVDDHQKAVDRFQQETGTMTGATTGGTARPGSTTPGATTPYSTTPGTTAPGSTPSASPDRPTGTTGAADEAAVNRWAKQTLPTLQKHLERAQQIQSRLEQPRSGR